MEKRTNMQFFDATIKNLEFCFTNGRHLTGQLNLVADRPFGSAYLESEDAASKFIEGILNVTGCHSTSQLEKKKVRLIVRNGKRIAIGSGKGNEKHEDRWLFELLSGKYVFTTEPAEKFIYEHKDEL